MNALVSVASVAAASPVIADIAPTQPDTELLALGRQLDELISTHTKLSEQYDAVWNAGYGERFEELKAQYRRDLQGLGDVREIVMRPGPVPSDWDGGADDRYMARLDDLQLEFGVGLLLTGMERATDAMDPISRAMLAIPATTLAGLAAKARCAAFSCSHYWNENDDDCDLPELHARKLMDDVLRLADASAIA